MVRELQNRIISLKSTKHKVCILIAVLGLPLLIIGSIWLHQVSNFYSEAGKMKVCGEHMEEMYDILASQHQSSVSGFWDTWTDILISEGFPSQKLLCSEKNGEIKSCDYAINYYATQYDFAELPKDIVLMFSSQSGWNQIGDSDLVRATVLAKGVKFVNVLFANGQVKHVPLRAVPRLHWKRVD